jgi:hypothetical protein
MCDIVLNITRIDDEQREKIGEHDGLRRGQDHRDPLASKTIQRKRVLGLQLGSEIVLRFLNASGDAEEGKGRGSGT